MLIIGMLISNYLIVRIIPYTKCYRDFYVSVVNSETDFNYF